MSDLYGSISLTKIGKIAKEHPELVKEVKFKDGHVEKMLKVNIYYKETDKYDNIAYMKVPCKPEAKKLDKSDYYLTDFKAIPEQKHTGGAPFEPRDTEYVPPSNPSNDEFPF